MFTSRFRVQTFQALGICNFGSPGNGGACNPVLVPQHLPAMDRGDLAPLTIPDVRTAISRVQSV